MVQKSLALVVVDSISVHFRHEVDGWGARGRVLAGLAEDLREITRLGLPHTSGVAVVLTNQVTTRFTATSSSSSSSYLAPALGESWGQHSDIRVSLLYAEDGVSRAACLLKSHLNHRIVKRFTLPGDVK